MAWENASGFADKINPILLSDTLLSQVSNNNETQTLIGNTGGNIPEGVTINTNYIGLPVTGTGDYSAPFSVYAEDNALVWNYSNWNYDGRKGSGCQLINPTNSRVMYQYSELRNIATNPINTWGFIVNHDLHYAKVVLLVNENGFGSLIVYALNESYGDATALYNALINNPYIPPDQNRSGGAGSGYIGNSLLSNKKMVGYNVPTSSAESTKTESVNEASETPVSGKPKIGNGFARIKFLRDVQVLTLEQITNGGQISGYTTISGDYTWNATPPWSEMDGHILFLKKYNGRPLEYDSNGGYFYFERKSGDSESNFFIPIPVRMKVTKITFDWMNSYRPTEWTRLGVKLEDTNQQAVELVDFLDGQVMSDYESYTKEFSSPVYANYILFFAWDGEYKIKNFKIYGSA